jgi:hypothetical protein
MTLHDFKLAGKPCPEKLKAEKAYHSFRSVRIADMFTEMNQGKAEESWLLNTNSDSNCSTTGSSLTTVCRIILLAILLGQPPLRLFPLTTSVGCCECCDVLLFLKVKLIDMPNEALLQCYNGF